MPGGSIPSFLSAMRSAASWARSTMEHGLGLPHRQYPARLSSGLCAGRGIGEEYAVQWSAAGSLLFAPVVPVV
jgi:hypothetical protein